MPERTKDELRRIAHEQFGWEELGPHQLEAMEAVMAGHDVLSVLPTGGGKSAIYQVPALDIDGPTLVVSPLIALQHDQIEGIEERRIPEAVAVNSTEGAADRESAWAAVRDGRAEYLFLAPEQLANDDIVAALADLGVSLFVVDEAHCVSAWGQDFRPDYLRLGPVIDRLGHPRVVALTATAAPPVRHDIVERLGLRDHREVIASFDRPSLHLGVEWFTDDADKRSAVITRARTLAADPTTRPGLVYTASRKDAEAYAQELEHGGARVAAYHAGMRGGDRDRVHQRFLGDELDVVVATSAFGMGIDKPDVRFVLHASAPESLDTYYQQLGRAGRDGEPAEITLCYRPEDLHLQRFLTASRAPTDALDEVLRVLDEHDGPVATSALTTEVDVPKRRATRAVNLLQQAGAVLATDDGALVHDTGSGPERPVDAAVEASEAHQRLVRSRIEMVRGYAETTDCRRRFLLGYFGEQLDGPCGRCDTCDRGRVDDTAADTGGYPVDSVVWHSEWGRGVVMSGRSGRITVLFDDVGYKTLSLAAVEAHHLLATEPSGPGSS